MEEVGVGESENKAGMGEKIDEDSGNNNSLGHVGQQNSMVHIVQQASMHNIGAGGIGTTSDAKFEKYEKDVCEKHDQAVERYKKAIKSADIWREHLYKYINANLPSGNH